MLLKNISYPDWQHAIRFSNYRKGSDFTAVGTHDQYSTELDSQILKSQYNEKHIISMMVHVNII